MKKFKIQNGNALFFILIAIALLGLLTMTMTKSSSTSNDTGSFEQNQIAASEILTYAKSIENAVQSLLARGCSENEISFENDVFTTYANSKLQPTGGHTNPNSSCKIFDVEGAGLTPLYFSKNAQRPPTPIVGGNWKPGTWALFQMNSTDDISTKPNVLVLGSRLTKNACMSLNTLLKVQNPSSAPPDITVTGGFAIFNGTFNNSLTEIDLSGTPMDGKNNFCARQTSNDAYNYFHIIIKR